ncbi:MAG: hypothetical protein J2P13_09425 [Acidobacteria bacterium]|nr:hypothetical protein [Acidobacteriota bacterium]
MAVVILIGAAFASLMTDSSSGIRTGCLSLFCAAGLALALAANPGVEAQPRSTAAQDALRAGFASPPPSARLRCYWWWLNGNTTAETITHDLEGMKSHGFGGAILVDADGSGQEGNLEVREGPPIGSPKWIALFVHALETARRLGLEISLNVTSRWNVGIIGGATVTPEDAMKRLTWSRSAVEGGGERTLRLAQPKTVNGFYRGIATLAYPLAHGAALAGTRESGREAILDLPYKTASIETGFSMPPATQVLRNRASVEGEEDSRISEVLDLSSATSTAGELRWDFPPGTWEVLRVGYTDSNQHLADSTGRVRGLPLDAMSARAFDHYWQQAVEPLLKPARPYLGKSLRSLVTDSWEAGGTNWTDGFREEFRRRRGYDPVRYLPIISGRILDNRDRSDRFLFDLRRTVADLIAENYYDRFAAKARAMGLETHPEAGGPHGAPIDALENFRSTSYPQTEFWVASRTHRVRDDERFFVKEAASAAHIYGKPFVAAEGPTSMVRAAWSESLGTNLEPAFDQALTEGLNRLFWHEFTSSPAEYGKPGQEYFAGTHLNPNVTWWDQAPALVEAFNRAQFLMQQGSPVADLLYFYGDQVPGMVRLKADDPARVLPGYDYDVTDEDALLGRLEFSGNRGLRTPEGVEYRALSLPESRSLSYPALVWVSRFVRQGGTLIGLEPTGPLGIISEAERADYDRMVRTIWSGCRKGEGTEARYGEGRIECTANARAALAAMGIAPDFTFTVGGEKANAEPVFDYVHRKTRSADIYFVRSTGGAPVKATLSFRVHGRAPELWMADDGSIRPALVYRETSDGRTEVPLAFPPHGSIFVVFAQPSTTHLVSVKRDGEVVFPSVRAGSGVFAAENQSLVTTEPGNYQLTDSAAEEHTIAWDAADPPAPRFGDWTLSFPAGWGAPPSVSVERFQSWTEWTIPGVRYFSGTATYRATLHVRSAQLGHQDEIWLDLGDVREIASVMVNGRKVQTVWRAPFLVRIDQALHDGENSLAIEVTNLWPNRIIGDLQPSAGTPYAHTGVRAYSRDSPLLPSGLLDPVRIVVGEVER